MTRELPAVTPDHEACYRQGVIDERARVAGRLREALYADRRDVDMGQTCALLDELEAGG